MDMEPATDDNKRDWKGFCEIESDPALFTSLLRKFGVQGVKVQEIVSFDDKMLCGLPRPIYGLIFLFKWVEQDVDEQEQSCPDDIWFANQTSNNSCASVALLNIVNNIPELALGDPLESFKCFTRTFSPAIRGDAISNFFYVKQIHNSFARKMDMLNTDLHLKNQATARAKGQIDSSQEGVSEGGFHFIAFMPIMGMIWQLDGLQRQPKCLGPCSEDWFAQARPDIQAQMAQYAEENIEFAVLSLVRDPMIGLRNALALNIKSIIALDSKLDQVAPRWRNSEGQSVQESSMVDHISGADESYGVRQDDIDKVSLLDSEAATKIANEDIQGMEDVRQGLISDQVGLRSACMDEICLAVEDDKRVAARCRDLGSKIQRFSRLIRRKESGRTVGDHG